MSYFLWVEDFEGSPEFAACQVLGEILDKRFFSEDKENLKRSLKDHGVFVELSFQDGLSFIRNKLPEIDYVILDIDLCAYCDGDGPNEYLLRVLEQHYGYSEAGSEGESDEAFKQKLNTIKKVAGFHIYTELVVELGFPKEHILFYSQHAKEFKSIQEAFETAKISLPPIYLKADSGVTAWVSEKHQTPYSRLRRGIIEGCKFLKQHIDKCDENIQFRDFIKLENDQPVIEVPVTEVKNYLDALSQSLNIRQPINQPSLNIKYRLFLRTLSHEWEENINPNSLKKKSSNLQGISDIYTFARIMKMTRNWVSHAKLLEPLNSQFIAFVFLVNMRAMFKLPKAIQPYEKILLNCVSQSHPNRLTNLNDDIEHAERCVEEILAGLKIDANKVRKDGSLVEKNFGEKINDIYRQNTGNPDAEPHDFKKFLLQYFWISQKNNLNQLNVNSSDFLPTLARHIYTTSFPEA